MFVLSHSDGTARTGTYILIDMVLNRMAKGELLKRSVASPIISSRGCCRYCVLSRSAAPELETFSQET